MPNIEYLLYEKRLGNHSVLTPHSNGLRVLGGEFEHHYKYFDTSDLPDKLHQYEAIAIAVHRSNTTKLDAVVGIETLREESGKHRLYEVIVRQNMQGQGICSVLTDICINAAKNIGIQELWATTKDEWLINSFANHRGFRTRFKLSDHNMDQVVVFSRTLTDDDPIHVTNSNQHFSPRLPTYQVIFSP